MEAFLPPPDLLQLVNCFLLFNFAIIPSYFLTFPDLNVSQLLEYSLALICKSESPLSLGPGPRVLKLNSQYTLS